MWRATRMGGICAASAALIVLLSLSAFAKGPGGGGHGGGGHAAGPSAKGASGHGNAGRGEARALASPSATVGSPRADTFRGDPIGGTKWYGQRVGWGGRGHDGWFGGSLFGDWLSFGLGWPWWDDGYYYTYDYPYYRGWTYNYDDFDYYGPSYRVDSALPAASGNLGASYAQARQAFRQQDYRVAIRMAGHAAVDHPQSRDVHLLLSTALFAAGDYRGAAMEAHATAGIGPLPDWPTMAGLYGEPQAYTGHLRALEAFTEQNPRMPEGRFLLGFHYLVDGHPEAARGEFLAALKLAPQDQLAAQLLKQAGGTVPDDIARQLAPSPAGQPTPPKESTKKEELPKPIPVPPTRM